ncbi:MAG: endonuclease MutS2, partial [Bacteroidales bacterium]|nr:endonuclease MutS2 [Bacteroidales bacterium]
MIYPDSFEQKTGFVAIRQWIAELCTCDPGVQKVNAMNFSADEEVILHRVGLTEEFRQILLMESSFPALDYKDLTGFLKRIRIEGTWIDTEELAAFRFTLETLRLVLGFLSHKDENSYPLLRSLAEDVKYYPFLLQRIDAVLDKFGRIKDNASPALASIRREQYEKSSAVSRVMQKVLKQAQAEGWVESDASPAVRDGRTVIPVTSAFKRKVQGIVHDESSTGKTSYIEPAEVVETNNQIRELELAERREIIKILTQLTDEFRPYLPDILNSCDFLGSLDFIRAKALLALKMNAVKPICFNRSSMRWVKAVHPLMFLAHSREGKEVVPLDINLDERQRIILISGPNAGGKSVCLKTLGLLQYMFQCGMLVPMSENSEMGIFHQIFMDIGDEQSIENDLSTYSSHLMNMKYFLRNADDRTLILIDEFGTGTEPALGGAIAESVLDHLNHKSVYGVVTTHYTNLKHFASSAEGIVNGAMLYDTRRMQPLFRLEIGMPGSSFAFEIARNIGLPEEILTQASERIGKDHIDFDKHLREIVRDKRYWESKREKIHQSEKKLEAELAKHTLELDRLEKDRKMILEQTRAEARELLSGVNRQIEATIREIRESQAEKEKTRE